MHYPFENDDWFDTHYPGDFIVEYIGQTRGWFYTLHILATALFDRPAYKNVVSHGIVLGSDGQKMSKSLRNYPDVSEVLDRDGSDAMRWLLMSSPILRGGNLIVTECGIREGVRQVMLPLWNVYHFFTLYTNAAFDGEGYEARPRYTSDHVMDRFILARTRQLITDVTAAMDAYDVWSACEHLRHYADALTNWYVRRSRQRFFDEDIVAFDVLWTCLETVCRVAAPLLPLTAEEMWRGLTGRRSVHLADWPGGPDPRSTSTVGADPLPRDAALVAAMDRIRQVASGALSLRKSAKVRVRQPLPALTVAAPDAATLEPFTDLLRDEVNVREVRLTEDVAGHGRFELAVNARAAGPRLGGDVQKVIRAVKAGEWSANPDGTVTAGGIDLVSGEFTEKLVAADPAHTAALPATESSPSGGLVVLDTGVTPELAAEGTARDVVRVVQQARRDAGLAVSDRIALELSGPEPVLDAVRAHEAFVAGEVLAVGVTYGADASGSSGSVVAPGGDTVTVHARVARA